MWKKNYFKNWTFIHSDRFAMLFYIEHVHLQSILHWKKVKNTEKTPVQLLIKTNILISQSHGINWHGQNNLLMFKPSIRMGVKGKLEHGMVFGAR